MALVIADRVRETTTTTGTGTITLAGAVTNFETFTSNLSNSDTTYYAIVDHTNGAFEVGLGTFTSSGTTLARTTVIASSNSNSAVNFGSGTKEVFITVPASKMVVEDASDNVAIGGTVTATGFSGSGASLTALNVSTDSTPQLGGNLDTNSHNILIDDAHFIGDENGNEQIIFQTTSSAVNQLDVTNAATGNSPEISATGGDTNISLKITPKGSGQVLLDGNVGVESGTIDLKNSGSRSKINFYCESGNAHAQALQAAPHSESASNTLTLPSTGGDVNLVSTASTATLTNKTFGDNVSFGDNNITNVGDIAVDSISADGTDINVAVSDNSATAFTIKQGSDNYLVVDTANSSESVAIGTGISGTAVSIGHTTSETTVNDNLTVTGNLTVSGTTTTVDSTTINVQNTLVFEGSTANEHETTLTTVDPTGDRTISLPNQSGTLPVLAAASTTQITSTPEELNLLDGVSGLVQADFTKLAAVDSTAAELNLLDGSAKSTSSITIADSDAIIIIDGTTTKQIPASDIKTYAGGDSASKGFATAMAIAL